MRKNGVPAIERKALAWDQTVEDRVVTGFAAVIGNVDLGGDVLLPGAFAKTLQERADQLRFLWMHDAGQMPTANIVEIAEVGKDELPAEMLAKFPDAVGGLRVKREYLETPRGEEAFVGVKKGAIKQLSFAYDAIGVGTPDEALKWGKGAKRLLKEVRLWECSDVNWGMNPATMNVKAALLAELAGLPQEPGPTRQKALAEVFESRLHSQTTYMLDEMFGDGYLTREEWVALTEILGEAVDVFHAGLQGEDLQGVRTRNRWEQAPMAPASQALADVVDGSTGAMTAELAGQGPTGEQKAAGANGEPDAAEQKAVAQAMAERTFAERTFAERRRRVLVARQRLALVGA